MPCRGSSGKWRLPERRTAATPTTPHQTAPHRANMHHHSLHITSAAAPKHSIPPNHQKPHEQPPHLVDAGVVDPKKHADVRRQVRLDAIAGFDDEAVLFAAPRRSVRVGEERGSMGAHPGMRHEHHEGPATVWEVPVSHKCSVEREGTKQAESAKRRKQAERTMLLLLCQNYEDRRKEEAIKAPVGSRVGRGGMVLYWLQLRELGGIARDL